MTMTKRQIRRAALSIAIYAIIKECQNPTDFGHDVIGAYESFADYDRVYDELENIADMLRQWVDGKRTPAHRRWSIKAKGGVRRGKPSKMLRDAAQLDGDEENGGGE